MQILLTCKNHVDTEKLPKFDSDLDCIESMLMNVCEQIDNDKECEFQISGFGESRWPVDVDTDLVTFLEQLPLAIRQVSRKKSFSIDFYEQGIERVLMFSHVDEEWIVKCESKTDWNPSIELYSFSSKELENMLDSNMTNFLNYVAPILEIGNNWSDMLAKWNFNNVK